jgi:hypothetical protein
VPAIPTSPLNTGSKGEKKMGAPTPVIITGLKKGFAAPRNSSKEEITANALYVAKEISTSGSGAWKALDHGVIITTPPTIHGKMVLTFPSRRAGETYCKGIKAKQLVGVSAWATKPKTQDGAMLSVVRQREAAKASRKPREDGDKPTSTSTPPIDLTGEKGIGAEKRKREQPTQAKDGEETTGEAPPEQKEEDSPFSEDDDNSVNSNSMSLEEGEGTPAATTTVATATETTAAAPAAPAAATATAAVAATAPSTTTDDGIPAPRDVPATQSGRDVEEALEDQALATGMKKGAGKEAPPRNLEKAGAYDGTSTPVGKTPKISGKNGVVTPHYAPLQHLLPQARQQSTVPTATDFTFGTTKLPTSKGRTKTKESMAPPPARSPTTLPPLTPPEVEGGTPI